MTEAAPRVRFVVGGVQKGGTTALAAFLGRYPDVALPGNKEAHVFDAPDFDDGWDAAAVDVRYAPHFPEQVQADAVCGDATPIYLLHPRFVERIGRYNPDMRWVILLRDPIERAVSQYHMERGRGDETLPFWLALLAERRRLAGRWDDFSHGAPLRHHSYRLRGDYAAQLDVLYRFFPREQVLLLRNDELARQPQATMARVRAFLGLAAFEVEDAHERVFEGRYARWRKRGWRWQLLRWLWRDEYERQARRYGLIWEGE